MSDNSVDVQILTTILDSLVTVPDDLKIERKVDEQGVLLTVQVNPQDMGIVIGRGGSMATAIKTVMRAVGKANQMYLRIQFLEPDGSTTRKTAPASSDTFKAEVKNEALASDIDDDLTDFEIN